MKKVEMKKVDLGFKTEFNNFRSVAKQFIGQPVALLCARYQYRGILSEVNDECLILANARAVENSGENARQLPVAEDPINSSVVIKNDAVEILYQPNWCFAELEVAT